MELERKVGVFRGFEMGEVWRRERGAEETGIVRKRR